MKRWASRILRIFVLVFALCVPLLAGGCEGTDTRNQVDDGVAEMAGKNDLERYKQMKKDLNAVQTRQTEKYRQLNDNPDDE